MSDAADDSGSDGDEVEAADAPTGIMRWIERPRRANRYAVIASILMVVVVIALSVRLTSIDFVARSGPIPVSVDEIAVAAAALHERLLSDPAMAYSSMEETAGALHRELRVDRLLVPEMAQIGLHFHGGQSVELADAVSAGQLVYASRATGRRRVWVSVVMIPNRGAIAVAPTIPGPRGSEWQRWQRSTDSVDRGTGVNMVLMASDESFVYLVVSHDETAMEGAARRVGALAGR